MWDHLMDEKEGLGKETIFDFKYVPSLNRTTKEGQRKTYLLKRPGIEVLSYMGLLAAFGSVATLSTGLYLAAAKVLLGSQVMPDLSHIIRV